MTTADHVNNAPADDFRPRREENGQKKSSRHTTTLFRCKKKVRDSQKRLIITVE